LCLLREQHPERPHSKDEVIKMWSSRVGGVHFIQQDCWTDVETHLETVLQNRQSLGFRFSSVNFKDLLHKAVVASWERKEDFDIMKALGIRDPSSTDAGRYLNQFIASVDGRERHDIIASCLAYNVYAQATHGL
jgi:hypothetical protein